MKPKEKHILETFKQMLEQRVHLNTFALFGSRARGDAGRYSDMDVLVVVDQLDTLTADYISDCAWESGFGSGIVVVPVSYSKSECGTSGGRSFPFGYLWGTFLSI